MPIITVQTPDMSTKSEEKLIFNFFIKLCKKLSVNSNIVCSPLSIGNILALLAMCTDDEARDQILKVFDVSNYDMIRKAFLKIAQRKEKIQKNIGLSVANKIFIHDSNDDINPDTLNEAEKVFRTKIEKISLRDEEQATKLINSWVNNETHGTIKELFHHIDLSGNNCVILVNAIFFGGLWKHPFNPADTRPGRFLVNSTKSLNVPMMYKEGEFKVGFSDGLKAKILEMPYKTGDAATLVLLPDEIDGLVELMEKLLEGYNLLSEIKGMAVSQVRVFMPRFRMETELDLTNYLPKIGVSKIFNSGDSGITKLMNSSLPPYVTHAVQRTIIEFSEKGTIAAAAAGFQVEPIREDFTEEFLANHPFLAITFIHGIPNFFVLYYGGDNDFESALQLQEPTKRKCEIS